MRFRRALTVVVAAIVVGVAGFVGFQHFAAQGSSPILVYSADAYVQEANYYLSGFHNSSGVPVATAKGAGSYTAASEIGQGDPANAFISVALESYNQSYLGQRYSGWAVGFASDQLVLAYSNSTHTSQVNSIVENLSSALSGNSTTLFRNAFNQLTSGNVSVGISDPASDPAGLRGWISLEIAGNLYGGGNNSFFTSRIMDNHGVVNNSNAALLVSPLLTGNIQFLFIYKSAAISKGLNYVDLPSSLNFGDPSLSSYYHSFSFNTTSGVAHGSAIMLYISALSGNGPSDIDTLDFVTYVLNHSSEMSSFGLTPLQHPVLYSNLQPPALIQAMVNSGQVVQGGRF